MEVVIPTYKVSVRVAKRVTASSHLGKRTTSDSFPDVIDHRNRD